MHSYFMCCPHLLHAETPPLVIPPLVPPESLSSSPIYIERECANVDDIVKQIVAGNTPLFVGPKGCGKSTTLCRVYQNMERSGYKVHFIDLKLLPDPDLRFPTDFF